MAPQTALSCLRYPEPPTLVSLEEAKRELEAQRLSAKQLNDRIQTAEDNLARLIQESQCAIQQMERERIALEDDMAQMLAYISPIKRLPQELLRQIFYMNFEDYPCCAWVLAAVCKLWRRLALSMPKIWSKIRLVTTQESSADIIRLWVERSGQKIPLDIEIFLKCANTQPTVTVSRRRRASTASTIPDGWTTPWADAAQWITPLPPHPMPPPPMTPYVDFGAPHNTVIPLALPTQTYETLVVPVSADRPHSASSQSKSRASLHWGYIAFFYLTEQMHRWERFVFRFDRKFPSFAALRNVAGDAPLLREFEVSCAEPAFAGAWTWLPCSKATSKYVIPELQSLTLQYVPFEWSAPIFANLRHLSLRTLPTNSLSLDRILYLITQSPELESLALYHSSVNNVVLPLAPTVLRRLKVFSIGGHYLLNTLVDSLSLPAIRSLTIDLDNRDSVEDTIANLVARSNSPPLTTLSLAYGTTGNPNGIYYAPGSMIASWHFLREMDHLRTLQVGGVGFENFLTSLTFPDDENGQEKWLCPNLTTLAIRGCHSHGDGVSKLVQMIDARNPDASTGNPVVAAAGVVPTRLKRLEVHDCVIPGMDVMVWLQARIDEVVVSEPPSDSIVPRSPPYQYSDF
ncbi:hypothetical protein BXZ70DRAFT_944188 [Cristinia sonorae]|uniref:F-box domain-containing protein n=1 Tax=Cristinia sonorae TaxID=1940300 RepID=A0A8K0ULN8_9AGAR|nr:hypothetical protein BXZ70DRAFT_944188 [Cristinia sonorae]